ncbi:MAG: hypothetical protein P9M03_01330 [Candidatus Theseobacter exili]|nr:hypothetical protein [Candidatus Theseobacter exili]
MNSRFRNEILNVNLEKLEKQYIGTEYRVLVQELMRNINMRLEMAETVGIEACTEKEKKVVEILIDEFNKKAYDKIFWRLDTSDVLKKVCIRFKELALDYGAKVEDEILFNAFNMIAVNYAIQARDQKALRKFVGIRKSIFFR